MLQKKALRLPVKASKIKVFQEGLVTQLHDQVGQNLTVLGIYLHVLRSSFPGEGSKKISDILDDSIGLVEQIAASIRGLMQDLEEGTTSEFPFPEAWSQLAQKQSPDEK